MDQLTCSVIINTYNRVAYLRRLLGALDRLRDAEFEVVVVNGPSTDGTAALLDTYRGRIKVVSCPERNLSRSRNLGIAAASGDLVVFIDDDALPEDPLWLHRFVAAFQQAGSRLGAAGGPVRHRDTSLFEFNGGATSAYGFQRFGDQAGDTAPDGTPWIPRVPGGNSAYRRSALISIGGFDEFFVYYLDEADVCFRLARAGYSILHLPDNPVRHYSGASDVRGSSSGRNWRLIARSDTYYALKNSSGPLPLRLARTLAAAPRKHFVADIDGHRRRGEMTRGQWAAARRAWLQGVADGVRAGISSPRLVRRFEEQPPPFLPFEPAHRQPRLRVALLSKTIPLHPSYGGIGRYTFDLALGLHERGHEVHIICQDEQPLQMYSLGFLIHGISTHAAAGALDPERPVLNKNLAYSVAVARRLAELHAEGTSFDIIHASNWDLEALALIRAGVYPVALMLVSPLAQIIHTEGWKVNDDLRASVAMDRWQIEHADAVCVPSDGVLSTYRSLMGIAPERLPSLHRTPLGIVPDTAPMPNHPPRARRKLLFVGRCERRKGAHVLLAVLPKLLAAHPQWECHLVGNDNVPLVEGGTLKQRFLAQHRDAPWLSRVFFHGEVDEATLQHHYQTCDLFVAPSLFESFGLIYHEAMQYGKAVVGCRTGGVPEVVADGVEGLLVTPDSEEELFTALKRLMDDDELRLRMGEAGRQRVHDQMNYRTMAADLEGVYREVIERHGAEARRRRESMWGYDLLTGAHGECGRLLGDWTTAEAIPGAIYRRGDPDATLQFEAQGGSLLQIIALRHEWSGILEVRADGQVVAYIDLYKPGPLEPEYGVTITLPEKSEGLLTVTLRVHPERNPASYDSQVWLRRVVLRPPLEARLAPDPAHAGAPA